jgi:hypothetical protein
MPMENKMLKRLILFFVYFSASFSIFSEISVKSFRILENDLTARVDAQKKDQNGDLCAIIKVVSSENGFIWEPDALGIVSSEYKGGEYWLYIPYGAKRLTIKHPYLGLLRDYYYPLPIEKASVYELVLISGKIEISVINEINSQWLVINPEPKEAMIYLNDQYVGSGVYQSKRKPGKYVYRVEYPLFYSENGVIEIADEKKVVNVKLKPSCGFLSVSSSPEQDARIILDGKTLSKITPCIDTLACGDHDIQIIKDGYAPYNQRLRINEGETVKINVKLLQYYSELTINTKPNASIFINNVQKSTGPWKERMLPGVYSLEARMDRHKPVKQDIELVAGENKSIELNPKPIFGSLDIVTNPPGTSILIDGKIVGTTPYTINEALIGDYVVELQKAGFKTVERTVSIEEGQSEEVVATLKPNQEPEGNRLEKTLRLPSLKAPKKMRFFFNAGMAMPLLKESEAGFIFHPYPELKVGLIKKWGAYLKVSTSIDKKVYILDSYVNENMTFEKKARYSNFSISLGPMYKTDWAVFYGGLGLGRWSRICVSYVNSDYVQGAYENQKIQLNMGCMFFIKKMNFSLGASSFGAQLYDVGLGIGYSF